MRNGIIFGFFAALLVAGLGTGPGTAQTTGPETGKPLPRFETLRFDTVRMRRGPSQTYPIAWLFKRKGLPVQVFREYQDWRQVRDPFGDIGWIKRTQLSSARYGLVREDRAPLYRDAKEDAVIAVRAEAGVVLRLSECSINWCYGAAKGYGGWVRKEALWGVAPEEKFKGE